MAERSPLVFTFYIAGKPEKVWDGFTSVESNRVLFMGAELKADLRKGGEIAWMAPGKDGKITPAVYGRVLRSEPPRLLQYTFSMGQGDKHSRATIELTPESEATKVVVTHDQWAPDDNNYNYCADGWPRILSRLKTLIETGTTFKPH